VKQHSDSPANSVSRETATTGTPWWTAAQFNALASYLGLTIDADTYLRLEQFAGWLVGEAQRAGGIGPAEHLRLFDRHIADSLMYVKGLSPSTTSIVDIGSGVGLPGIPLAILLPDVEVTMVDRSEKRTGLARRCNRMLGLTNVHILTASSEQINGVFDAAVFRASLPIPLAAKAFSQITDDVGVGVVGVSRRQERPVVPEPEHGLVYQLTPYGAEVLDSPFWLLRMTHGES
jgi:16S rRNA (guanine(527)-N(7))-methyltransferase RsmG